MGSSSRHTTDQHNGFFSAASLTAAAILVLDLGFTLVASAEQRIVFADLLSPIIEILTLAVLIAAAVWSNRISLRLGRAWTMIALSIGAFAAGDLTWTVLELFLKEPPFPSLADLFYLLYYPLLLAGVLLLQKKHHSPRERAKRLLDMSVVLLAGLLGFWNYLLGLMIQANVTSPLIDQAVALAYPIGDLVLFCACILLLFNRSENISDTVTLLLTCSMVVTIVADCIYSYQTLTGIYQSGNYLDISWNAGVLLLGLAGASQVESVKGGPGRVEKSIHDKYLGRLMARAHYLPYLWLVGAYLLLVAGGLSPLPMNFISLASVVGVIIGLVLARQWMTLAENQSLNLELQRSIGDYRLQAAELEITNLELSSEISERKRVEERLSFDSLHDAMTKMANRVLFMDRLGQALEYCKRRPEYSFAVLFVDLDEFKVINDSLGHFTGDQLLVEVSGRMRACLRTSDTVARFGGDEFAILLEMTGEDKAATKVAEKLLTEIRNPYSIGGHELYITASIGLVMNMAGYDDPEEVLRDADIAMYQAKASGKARFEVFDLKMRSMAFTRLELERELRTALERGELRLYYQPIISLENDQITSVEALIRWVHPQRGLLLPGDFLPVAEQSGLILPIGQWVLQQACSQLAEWHRKYPRLRTMTVNVNISNKQFLRPDFVTTVLEALDQSGLRPQSLKLEIIESVLIGNYAAANAIFRKLQDLGIQIEIDDFGSGYSALGYLQHLPINTIKIDKSFVDGIGRGSRGTELIRAIVSMARELEMETIAEGVESEEQMQELKKLACGFGQGFWFSRPLDEAAVEVLIREGNRRA